MNDEDQRGGQETASQETGTQEASTHGTGAGQPGAQDNGHREVTDAVVENPATGTMSAERIAAKSLETRLLGGERKLRRREVAAGVGLSLLSARKLWRALGFPNWGDDDVAFTERDQAAQIGRAHV